MMIRTAGGPGMVSPIDFHERRTPRLSRSAWLAIGLVAAGHVGVGIALYYQRFELRPLVAPPVETPPIEVTFQPPPPKPEPVRAEREPPPPNAPVHQPETVIPSEVETLPAARPDDTVSQGSTTITVSETVEAAVPDARPTEARPPAPAIIRNPSWSRQPSAEEMMRAYPDRALQRGLAGSVTLNCMVETNGSVSACAVTGETPAGNGFGRAAQQLSRRFVVNPRTVDGAAEGSRVIINLRFVPPAD